jgi:hypothetical protein
MATFNLRITGVSAYPTVDNLENVVFDIHWAYEGTDGTFSTAMSGTTMVPAPSAENFVPFDQLTEQMVKDWVIAFTDAQTFTNFENLMTDWLAAQHNPPVVYPPLPWATANT